MARTYAPVGIRGRSRTRVGFGTLLTASGALLVAGCYDQVFVPGDASNDRLELSNDELLLQQRVTYPGTLVPIDPAGPSPSGPAPVGGPPARAPSSITLTLKAEVTPPTVGGNVVQATSVSATSDNKAVFSYNLRGSAQVGAVDYFIRMDKSDPTLKSAVQLADADVSAVTTDGGWVYLALASEAAGFAVPAVLERLRLEGNKFVLTGNLQVPLTSFAATSTLMVNGTLYATSGDGGDVFAMDPDDLSVLGQYALDDARWVAWDEPNGRVAVAQGTPGRISVFEEGQFPGGSFNLLNTYAFPGADVAESKSTVDVAGGKAFVAAGPEGVQVVCLDDGQIVGSVPRPDPASLGLDPSVVVTNAVAVEDDLMFISNGEAGVYVAAGADRFEDTACDAPQSITVLGQLRFDDLQSVNHVEYRRDNLFIAAGLGGVKVVEVDAN